MVWASGKIFYTVAGCSGYCACYRNRRDMLNTVIFFNVFHWSNQMPHSSIVACFRASTSLLQKQIHQALLKMFAPDRAPLNLSFKSHSSHSHQQETNNKHHVSLLIKSREIRSRAIIPIWEANPKLLCGSHNSRRRKFVWSGAKTG